MFQLELNKELLLALRGIVYLLVLTILGDLGSPVRREYLEIEFETFFRSVHIFNMNVNNFCNYLLDPLGLFGLGNHDRLSLHSSLVCQVYLKLESKI